MPTSTIRTLRNLRNTRDFRAELLNIAASLAANTETAVIHVQAPAISSRTVREEWSRLIVAIEPSIAARMRLELGQSATATPVNGLPSRPTRPGTTQAVTIERPNYRAEVLRLLVGASLANDGMWSVKGLIEQIGASQTPVRQALADLKRAGLLHDWSGSHVDLVPENLTAEQLAKLNAAPQMLRFRFERGARLRTPAELLERALPLLAEHSRNAWAGMALSGTAVAQAEVPELDLAGAPRLDLVAFVPRAAKNFDAALLRTLSDGLEHEPNVLATAPLVVTLVRADSRETRLDAIAGVRCAPQADVFLALIDMNLRKQAAQYARAIRS
jgi:hypothetical protein